MIIRKKPRRFASCLGLIDLCGIGVTWITSEHAFTSSVSASTPRGCCEPATEAAADDSISTAPCISTGSLWDDQEDRIRNTFIVPAQMPMKLLTERLGRFWNHAARVSSWWVASEHHCSNLQSEEIKVWLKTTESSPSYQYLVRRSCRWSLLVSSQHF